jgi:hypothetical protein
LNVLRDVGIAIGQFDTSEWEPAEKGKTAGNRCRAEAMRKAHQAVAHMDWLNEQWVETLQQADRPSLWRQDYNEVRPQQLPANGSVEVRRAASPARWRCSSVQLNNHRDQLILQLGLPRYEWHGRRVQVMSKLA